LKKKLNINESFICKIWEAGELYYSNLHTTDNEKVEVLELGSRNFDSGPDYRGAKIRVNGKVYKGDVEVHRDFRSWADHNHPKDRSYNTVILQVVLWDSPEKVKPKLRIKRELPTVILSSFLNRSIHSIWQEIIDNPSDKFKLPCFGFNNTVTDEKIRIMMEDLALERLKLKTLRIKERLNELYYEKGRNIDYRAFIKNSLPWQQVLYEYMFEALGYSKNKETMLTLAKNLPLQKINRFIGTSEIDELKLIQSLLYGSAGFLFDVRYRDDYITELKNSWLILNEHIKNKRIDKAEWKFFRMRPSNFPTVRIAYGSQIILKLIKGNLFKDIILSFQADNFRSNICKKRLFDLFSPEEDDYWSTHYDFGKQRKSKNKLIGSERIDDIISNVIIPLAYYYSIVFKKEMLTENVLIFYKNMRIHPVNSVLNILSEQVLNGRGIGINTPEMEQAAMQLYNFYCMRERCGECGIGKNLVKEKGYQYKIIFY
jgi:hypothetical protein